MRVVAGKQVRQMDATEVAVWVRAHETITIDLGTGDGRFVRGLAAQRPEMGVIGVDLCAATMGQASRAAGVNGLFVVADALALPVELRQAATRMTVQFPWGSLPRGLLSGQPGLMAGLRAISREGAGLDILVNAGALAEAGWTLEDGRGHIGTVLRQAGMAIAATADLGPAELRRCQTTRARRLAYGRDPRAFRLRAAPVLMRRRPGVAVGAEALIQLSRA